MSWIAVGAGGVGMGMGVLKNGSDRKNAAADDYAASEQTRYSGWTGLGKGQMAQNPNSLMGDMFSGGMAGASMGSQIGLNQSLSDYYGKGGQGSPQWAPMKGLGAKRMSQVARKPASRPRPTKRR